MAILMKISKRLNRLKEGKSLGQGMLEFGIILPIVLTSFFTIIELARLYHAWVAVENGARFGVRYAITGEFDSLNCAGSCDDEAEEEDARVVTIKDIVWGGSETIIRTAEGTGQNSDPGYFKTTVCQPDNLVGPATQYDTYTCSSGEFAGEPGEQIAIIVEYNHPIIVPLISNIIPQIRLRAERQSIVETFRLTKSDGAPGYSPPPPPPAMTALPTGTAIAVSLPDPWCGHEFAPGEYMSAFRIHGGWVSGSNAHQLNGYLKNNTPYDVELVAAELEWEELDSSGISPAKLKGMYYKWMNNDEVFPEIPRSRVEFWDGTDGSSTTIAIKDIGSWVVGTDTILPANIFWPEPEDDFYRDAWRMSFNVDLDAYPDALEGKDFSLYVTFRFPDGFECTEGWTNTAYTGGGGGSGSPPPTPTGGSGGYSTPDPNGPVD